MQSEQAADGAVLFEQHCSGCHAGGSNIIGYARDKTLKVLNHLVALSVLNMKYHLKRWKL